jgi:hypothetical protein
MADIFLSYAREDRELAEQVANTLRRYGWSVWWDRWVRVGSSFDEVIDHELDACSAVMVLWSKYSIKSDWVLAEASEGRTRKILVPATIERPLRLPLEFRRLQTADLAGWPMHTEGFAECIAAITALAGSPPQARRPLPPHQEVVRHSRGHTSRPRVHPAASNVSLPAEQHYLFRVPHLRSHRAVTLAPMEQYQPLLWSAAKSAKYFTGRDFSTAGTLLAFFLLLSFLLVAVLWTESDMRQKPAKPAVAVPVESAPNSSLNPSRPGFDPGLKPFGRNRRDGVTAVADHALLSSSMRGNWHDFGVRLGRAG